MRLSMRHRRSVPDVLERLLLLLLLVAARGVLRVVVLQVRLGADDRDALGHRRLVGDETLHVVVARARAARARRPRCPSTRRPASC